jgi:16S rRNA (cytosine967-C5)-methyltransferase
VGPTTARRAAFVALRAWQNYHDRADTIISAILDRSELKKSDRAFALELFYGVLRNLVLIDFWVGCLRAGSLDPDLRDVVRLGLYQLFFLGTPDHAAVNESVEMVFPKQRGLINAMLRTAARDRDELRLKARRQPLAVRQSHPAFLVSRWQRIYGLEQTAELCEWNNQRAKVYARINRLKIDPEQFGQRYPETAEIPGLPDFRHCPDIPKDALARGHCYIQDPGTIIAGELLAPEPGETVLDGCAAPGGKTGHLAQLMQNKGTLIACDRDPQRIKRLNENIGRLGLSVVKTIQHDWTKPRLPKEIEKIGLFDRILIDVPCTNTGVMQRRVDVRWRLQPDSIAELCPLQMQILQRISELLKPGGVLVYSTCSLEPEENEQEIEHFLLQTPNWRLAEQRFSRPFVDHYDGAFAAKLTRSAPTEGP